MTFLETRDGQLVPARRFGELLAGETAWSGWPRPWAFRCDGCGATLPYGCILRRSERRTSITQASETSPDRHLCGRCDGSGFVDQLAMGL